jgi:hypothetical protein
LAATVDCDCSRTQGIDNEIADDGAYYLKQMHAYAVALAQQNVTRSVHISLVFTAIDADWTTELEPAEIEPVQEGIRTTLLAEAPEESGEDASVTPLFRVKRIKSAEPALEDSLGVIGQDL